MKRFLSLLLVAVLALSMAACGNNGNTNETTTAPTTEATTAPTTEATTAPTEATTEATDVVTENGLYMLTVMIGESYDTATTITVYNDDMGGCYIDFNGEIRKVTTLDVSALADIETALSDAGLLDLEAASEYGDGTNVAYVSAIYSDWSDLTLDYSGVEVPEAVTTGINSMIAYFETLLADVEEYVPQVQVYGDVDATLLAELQTIMNNSGIGSLDSMFVQGIPTDGEDFAYAAGLSSNEGISAAANCSAMMMTTAYSLVAVTTEDTAATAADFEANINWQKWVCVQPSNAAVAQKDGMVLCLIGSDTMYSGTLASLQAAGWTVVSELSNPDL